MASTSTLVTRLLWQDLSGSSRRAVSNVCKRRYVTVQHMRSRFADWRKAELHLHLEGSVERETLREINPSLTAGDLDCAFGYKDFIGFLQAYGWVCKQMLTPEHY